MNWNPLRWGQPKLNTQPSPAIAAAVESAASKTAKADEVENMATTATPLATAATQKKVSVLQHIGQVLRKALHIGEEIAAVAEPIVALRFPEVAPLYASTLGMAVQSEALLGSEPGTGLQKMQIAAPQLVANAQAWAKANNIDWPDADVQKWGSAVIDTMNLIPSPKAG